MMCRCLAILPHGYRSREGRESSLCAKDNENFFKSITKLYDDSGVSIGTPRMCEELCYKGETDSKNRIARLMPINV